MSKYINNLKLFLNDLKNNRGRGGHCLLDKLNRSDNLKNPHNNRQIPCENTYEGIAGLVLCTACPFSAFNTLTAIKNIEDNSGESNE